MLTTPEDYIEHKLTHQIHTSERMSRRGCRRRWDWIFHGMYYPYITAKPLEFGVAYHKAMETLYDPDNRSVEGGYETAYQLARVAFKQKCTQQRENFLLYHRDNYTSEVDEDYKERVDLGLGMLRYWYEHIMPRDDADFTPVKVEIPFEVPILGPSGEPIWCKCGQCWNRWKTADAELRRTLQPTSPWKGLPVTYGGRIDLLMQDRSGDYWIVDWKTTQRMTNAEQSVADEFLLLDDQITSYCWALRQLGIRVRGFIYVEIKKAYPREPEPMKSMRQGRLYSVNKQQDTSYSVYLETIQNGDMAGYLSGAYEEFLLYLQEQERLHPYVHSHIIIRNDTELDNASYNIWAEAQEMVDSTLINYPSPGRFACNFCAFREPCIAKNRDEDVEYALETLYEKRTKHYWETAEPTTDKFYDK